MDHATSESELLRASLAGSKEAFGVVVQRVGMKPVQYHWDEMKIGPGVPPANVAR